MQNLRTFVAGVIIAFGVPSAALSAAPDAVDAWPGVNGHRFETRAGRLTIYLPDDMRAGDTISGTVLADPAGRKEGERRKNRDTLEGYVYDAGGRRIQKVGGILSFTVPAAGLMALSLVKADGKTLVKTTSINIGSAASTIPQADPPRLAQAGRPLDIHGPFDGNAANTQASINGRAVDIIAESPRSLVVSVPDDPVGSASLSVNEGGVTRQSKINIVAVSLGAEKSVLGKGETTKLSVKVEGLLQTEIVPLTLVGSPTIHLEGGNAQIIPLQPDNTGTAAFSRMIHAVSPGPYEVSAQVMARQDPPKRDPLFPDALDMNGIGSVKELLGIVASMNDDARTALLQATLNALKKRLGDAKDEKTRKWLKNKIAIVEGAMDVLGIRR